MTIIIAEAGVNHNGDLSLAKKLIDAGHKAGADYIKFQTFKAESLAIPGLRKADYQVTQKKLSEDQFEMLRSLELSNDMYKKLLDYANVNKIKIFSTSFGIEESTFLSSLNQKIFKIPSGEITNLPYLRHIAKLSPKQIYLSTGMSNLNEVIFAVDSLVESGYHKKNITVMHCTSCYPANAEEINLRAMLTMKNEIGVDIGYSDHTLGSEVAIAAVAMGASVIEKHFTLDKSLSGPDHKASLNPCELKSFIESIRKTDIALGSKIKKPSQNELRNRDIARKSLVAKKNIAIGEIFSNKNIKITRPGTGISPTKIDEYMGKPSLKNYSENDLID